MWNEGFNVLGNALHLGELRASMFVEMWFISARSASASFMASRTHWHHAQPAAACLQGWGKVSAPPCMMLYNPRHEWNQKLFSRLYGFMPSWEVCEILPSTLLTNERSLPKPFMSRENCNTGWVRMLCPWLQSQGRQSNFTVQPLSRALNPPAAHWTGPGLKASGR